MQILIIYAIVPLNIKVLHWIIPYKSVSCNYLTKVLKIKRHLNFVNASYLFTHISYIEKTYTTTAQEPSIYLTRLGIIQCRKLKLEQFITFTSTKIDQPKKQKNCSFLWSFNFFQRKKRRSVSNLDSRSSKNLLKCRINAPGEQV